MQGIFLMGFEVIAEFASAEAVEVFPPAYKTSEGFAGVGKILLT